MNCERCDEAIATVHQIVIGDSFNVKYSHLCESCADEVQAEEKSNLQQGKVSSILDSMYEEGEETKCSGCGITFEEFRNSGRAGCANCYSSFSSRLEALIKRIHGADQHVGNVSEGNELGKISLPRRIQLLEKELEKTVREEKYENAAELRDKLKKLKEEQLNAAFD